MRNSLLSLFIIVLIALFIDTASADHTHDFNSNERNMIIKGFELYKSGTFAGKYADGYYTNPNLKTQVLDFWSNGKWAKYDREGDGHHETMLQINGNQIEYVGTIGGDARFTTVSKSHQEYLYRPYWEWAKNL
jgi:hypothetical protein